MSKPFVSNIISQKYDSALDFHVTMYDNLPYQRDSDYCNADKLALNSGQVIKYFLCNQDPQKVIIDNKDSQMEQYLLELDAKNKSQNEVISEDLGKIPVDPDAITDAQIQTLLDDTGVQSNDGFSENDTPDETDDLSTATNPFANVEDW